MGSSGLSVFLLTLVLCSPCVLGGRPRLHEREDQRNSVITLNTVDGPFHLRPTAEEVQDDQTSEKRLMTSRQATNLNVHAQDSTGPRFESASLHGNAAALGGSFKSGSTSKGHNIYPSSATLGLSKSTSLSSTLGSRLLSSYKFAFSFSSLAKGSSSPSPGTPSPGHNEDTLGDGN